ncbi:hypothetical protein GCM10010964_42810 [Caldovatus sediminis]|uniref:Uncharacterized protein n=1 Tax=Caldovatus sediminis TaxID=2041189 RepID=A0A8J3ECZ8_9PROT|nr:hypothetical protein [Caldovatus sediminis]GGG50987.1 hypothetical protein GCM10010964_42810 [Caldovatus sediminis]
MLTAPWHVSIDEIEAALTGQSLPAAARDVAPHYACATFMERWFEAMDRRLGQRGVDAVPEAEWIAQASRAEVDALRRLPVHLMARC